MVTSLNFDLLKSYLQSHAFGDPESIQITPLPGGFSNLSFLVDSPKGKFVLRRPPFGDKISKAHDMNREYNVLCALEKAGYANSPKAVLYCDDPSVLGAQFFLMEFIEGIILRNKLPKGREIAPADFKKLTEKSLDCLLELHELELENSGLGNLGKPEGYVFRQVEGWIDRYFKSKTNEIGAIENTAKWLQVSQPPTGKTAFIHNDFKYDNLILDPNEIGQIKAVLDWEMATVGDPLMDLGTALAYWTESNDADIFKVFNLSYLPGNYTRQEIIAYYAQKSGADLSHILFYYVFGLFKVAVIAQQIYKRYQQGHSDDIRFAALIEVVIEAGNRAQKSIQTSII